MTPTHQMRYVEDDGQQYVNVADVVGLLLELHDKAAVSLPQIGDTLENIAVQIATPFMELGRADGS